MRAVDDDHVVVAAPCVGVWWCCAGDLPLACVANVRVPGLSVSWTYIYMQSSYNQTSVFYQQIIQVSKRRGVVAAMICVVLMRGWRCSTLILPWLLVWFCAAMRMIDAVKIYGILDCVTFCAQTLKQRRFSISELCRGVCFYTGCLWLYLCVESHKKNMLKSVPKKRPLVPLVVLKVVFWDTL